MSTKCTIIQNARRNMLKYASIASEPRNLILYIALTPQSGDSSGAILEVPFKALLHLPQRERSERTLKWSKISHFIFTGEWGLFIDRGETVYTKRADLKRTALFAYSLVECNSRITLCCPNLWTTCAGSCGSAIERSRERQRRARLPPQGIA